MIRTIKIIIIISLALLFATSGLLCNGKSHSKNGENEMKTELDILKDFWKTIRDDSIYRRNFLLDDYSKEVKEIDNTTIEIPGYILTEMDFEDTLYPDSTGVMSVKLYHCEEKDVYFFRTSGGCVYFTDFFFGPFIIEDEEVKFIGSGNK